LHGVLPGADVGSGLGVIEGMLGLHGVGTLEAAGVDALSQPRMGMRELTLLADPAGIALLMPNVRELMDRRSRRSRTTAKSGRRGLRNGGPTCAGPLSWRWPAGGLLSPAAASARSSTFNSRAPAWPRGVTIGSTHCLCWQAVAPFSSSMWPHCVVVDPYSVFGLFDFSRMNVERSFRYAKDQVHRRALGEYRGILFGNSRSCQFSERDMEGRLRGEIFQFQRPGR